MIDYNYISFSFLLRNRRDQRISDYMFIYIYTYTHTHIPHTRACAHTHTHTYIFCLFAFSRASSVAYGGSQARGLIGVVATGLCHSPQQYRIRATSTTYTTAHSNTGSLNHWAQPGIEPTTLWFLVGFVNHWATMGTSMCIFLIKTYNITF